MAGERPTPATVGARLPEARFPNIGEIGQDECDAAFQQLDEEAQAHAASLEQPATDEAQPPADVPQAEPAAPVDRDAALEALRLSHVALANARAAVITATNKRKTARSNLADAVSAWQSGLPRMTRDQAAREVIATHQATRGQRAAAPRVGPSYWDRVKGYSAGGDANDFARKLHQRGGNMRGAYPKSAMGRVVKQ